MAIPIPITGDHTEPIEFLIVDLFCGAGGTSTGFESAVDSRGRKIAKVIAAVNHDPKAIESHWKNHPDVKHFEEDIRTLDLSGLIEAVEFWKMMHPNAKLILWASLECTNFSKAKGGMPRDADSRTLANHLSRYVDALGKDLWCVMIENVVEFKKWGPLMAIAESTELHPYPHTKLKILFNKKRNREEIAYKPNNSVLGVDFKRWVNEINEFGFTDHWKELNSADFGAYTSRNRLFGCFMRPGFSPLWPEQTHIKANKKSFHPGLLQWKAVKDVLDLWDEGKSIFDRKKPLVDKTLERVYHGLIKYVAGGKDAFITKFFSGSPMDKNLSLDGPTGTLTTKAHQGLVTANFLMKRMSTDARTGEHRNASVDAPAPTITTQRHPELVTAFLANYYSNGDNTSSIDSPSATLRTGDGHSIVFIDKQYSDGRNDNTVGVERPAGTITGNDKHALVKAERFILNPSHGGHSTTADAPCPVIVARQDKAPLYVVAVEHGPVQVAVYEGDSEVMIRIKEFMAMYGIVDIKMRMLKVNELLRIQGFPSKYYLAGNQSDQKKFIGNSVHPVVPKVWIESISKGLKSIQVAA
jgi:DNA (cytosine-5)-methyltransferase 1